ncbi:MAG: peptidoglycan-binding protein [Candidatus Omnitrophica bacterium]|nr:peptidoglycan-binding protein [Candidatus Omnitrophota bacterium]
MGQKSNPSELSQSLAPAGSPLPAIQIEPIQPHEELAAIAAAPAPTDPSAPGASSAVSSDESARVREIQTALKNAGFNPGPVDGRMGPRTKVAIRDFQLANGLEADGKVGPRTWSRLEPYLKPTASTKTTD